MLNAKCKIVCSPVISIIAGGDTFILHFEFCILHLSLYERKYHSWIF